jgi:chemotaxis protein CheZ
MTSKSPDHARTAVLREIPADLNQALDHRSGPAELDVAGSLASIRQHLVPQAIGQLIAIIETTERAANQIMNACDALTSLTQSGERATAQLDRNVTAIFEACGFQDITGQRIAKVTKILRLIDREVGNLTSASRRSTDDRATVGASRTVSTSRPYEDGELAGPQLPEDAIDQSDADRLFSHLG